MNRPRPLQEGLGLCVTGRAGGKKDKCPVLVRVCPPGLPGRATNDAPLRRSTRCTFPFPASRKFHQHLGFSSPHKGRSPLRGPQWRCRVWCGGQGPSGTPVPTNIIFNFQFSIVFVTGRVGGKKDKSPMWVRVCPAVHTASPLQHGFDIVR